jgi:isopentenyldiphosphate isomerase
MAQITIVDERDQIIGSKERAACGPDDITRVSGLVVYNRQREILLSRRALSKQYDPGKWSYTVMGTVEPGETYVSNIIKESSEEIGLSLNPNDLKQNWYGYFETSHKFFYTQFTTETSLPMTAFVRQADEVEELRYVPAEELWRWIEERPEDFVHSMPRVTTLLRQGLGW